MNLYQLRKLEEKERKLAIKRFERQKRLNPLAQPGPHHCILILDHLKPKFNIGKIIRSADAFGAHEVHLIKTEFFDPAPAMGSFKWVPVKFFSTFDQCYQQLRERQYRVFVFDPTRNLSLFDAQFPLRSAFVFGNEEFGFSFDTRQYPQVTPLAIPQFGKVQSLNVSVAASVVLYEYVKQHH